MGLPNVGRTAHSGMMAAKAGIATSGHNISNANTEGFSRQRVHNSANTPFSAKGSQGQVGSGVTVDRVDRINDQYIEKQIRDAGRSLAHSEEKEMSLKQAEDIFNEMGGEGVNRLMSRFFNEFRKLANEPQSDAVRQAVRESSQSLVNDFKRIRTEVERIREHIDARIEGQTKEVNRLANETKDLNLRIRTLELSKTSPNDLLDKRDLVLKELSAYMDISTHPDKDGNVVVTMRDVGPLVVGPVVQELFVERTPANDQGKPESAFDIKISGSTSSPVTHQIKGGKLGALVEVRDQVLSTVLDRLDGLAFQLSDAVNQIHSQGFTADGMQGVNFFKGLTTKHRAAEFIDLSEDVKRDSSRIATAAGPDSPGDNRIALAISGIQSLKLMGNGRSTMDDFYNSIVSDVGVASAHSKSTIQQQKDIVNQLGKVREQISGVSIDEETTNLLQYQHAFDASAKVIQVADEMLKTVLAMR